MKLKIFLAAIVMALATFTTNAQLNTGYKGFVDLGYGIGTGDYGLNDLIVTTTHGYQIHPSLFIGAGLGVNYYHKASSVGVPIFADVRGNIGGDQWSFFVDAKIGYTVCDAKGFYCFPTVGVRRAITDKLGVNLGLGYQVQCVSGADGHIGAVGITLGLDF